MSVGVRARRNLRGANHDTAGGTGGVDSLDCGRARHVATWILHITVGSSRRRNQRLLRVRTYKAGGGKSKATLKVAKCVASDRTHHAVYRNVLVKNPIQKLLNPTDLFF